MTPSGWLIKDTGSGDIFPWQSQEGSAGICEQTLGMPLSPHRAQDSLPSIPTQQRISGSWMLGTELVAVLCFLGGCLLGLSGLHCLSLPKPVNTARCSWRVETQFPLASALLLHMRSTWTSYWAVSVSRKTRSES